jgi:hypothetical protein
MWPKSGLGQEYVDMYATKAKEEQKKAAADEQADAPVENKLAS